MRVAEWRGGGWRCGGVAGVAVWRGGGWRGPLLCLLLRLSMLTHAALLALAGPCLTYCIL